MNIKKMTHRFAGHQRGAILIPALVMLALGAIIIGPLLGFMATGLNAGRHVDINNTDYYAADAGVENALWYLNTFDSDAPNPRVPTTIGEFGTEYTINFQGKTITLSIFMVDENHYRISSVTNYGTTILANVDYGRSFLDNAISSPGSVDLASNTTVYGDIQTPTVIKQPNYDKHYGDEIDWDVSYWDELTSSIPAFYADKISGESAFNNSTYEVPTGVNQLGYYRTVGPLSITLQSKGTLQLTSPDPNNPESPSGTLYINGNLDLKGKNWNLDLNGGTLFVNGSITAGSESPGSITGPGAIIATGDIDFKPGFASDDYIFLMSIGGTVHFQPTHGELTGSIAGHISVETGNNLTIIWEQPPALNFPDLTQMIRENSVSRITSWDIR